MTHEKFIDLDSLSILTDAELHLFGEVDIDYALENHAWKEADMTWLKSNSHRNFLIRAVMQDEVGVRHKEVLNAEPTHVLIQKIGPNVRAKIFLVLNDANGWFGRTDGWFGSTDEGLSEFWGDLTEDHDQFIDVDAIFAPSFLRSRTQLEEL